MVIQLIKTVAISFWAQMLKVYANFNTRPLLVWNVFVT